MFFVPKSNRYRQYFFIFFFICNLSCSVDEKTDFWINKKHKGLKKNTPGMDFESYLERLVTLHKYCFESKSKKIEQKDFR